VFSPLLGPPKVAERWLPSNWVQFFSLVTLKISAMISIRWRPSANGRVARMSAEKSPAPRSAE
jgi:hypothetical protein